MCLKTKVKFKKTRLIYSATPWMQLLARKMAGGGVGGGGRKRGRESKQGRESKRGRDLMTAAEHQWSG